MVQDSELQFDGAVVAITGAGQGMGREYALLLARRGARIVVNDIRSERAEGVVAEIAALGGEAMADSGDVSDAAATDALVEAAMARWDRLDAVIPNAAVYSGILPDAEETARVLGVHLVSTINMARSALPVFRQRRYGRILNIGSGSMFGLPVDTIYAAGKSGVFGFTRSLAANLAKETDCDIRANLMLPAAFQPGMIDVPDAEMNRVIHEVFSPANIAPLAALLVHPLCPAQGEAIHVGGGRHARILLATTEGWQAPDAQTTPEAILAHWDEVMANRDPRETVGSMADLLARRGLPDYSVAELAEWSRTGRDPRAP
jgi:NAD(P)-dependent dehydrogenase (short-subunit alcohol dehydrogenase family)